MLLLLDAGKGTAVPIHALNFCTVTVTITYLTKIQNSGSMFFLILPNNNAAATQKLIFTFHFMMTVMNHCPRILEFGLKVYHKQT
jgi:hypothetical protein